MNTNPEKSSGRQYSPLDHLLMGVDVGVRTLFGQPKITERSNPAQGEAEAELSDSERQLAGRLMRINHAGEVAAQALYQGHASVARDKTIEEQMKHAADEEFDHLAWCEQRIHELGYEPSRLSPLWYAGAFAIGAASGVLGDKWSLGFIAETEKQVCSHLDSHLDRLPDEDVRSRAIVTQMRNEEEEHGEKAIAAGAADLPRPVVRLMQATAKVMTKTAYWV